MRVGTRLLLAGSCKVCDTAGSDARVRRWKSPPALPAGLTLASGAAWPTAFLHCSPPLQPRADQAWSQARLRKPWGLGARESRDRTPKLGASSDSDGRLPRGPLVGNLPFRKARRSLALRWAGLGLVSAPPGRLRSTRFPTEPSAFPAARKSSRASSTGLRRSYAHR